MGERMHAQVQFVPTALHRIAPGSMVSKRRMDAIVKSEIMFKSDQSLNRYVFAH